MCSDPIPPRPDPELAPAEVVARVLEALKDHHRSQPGSADTLYAFASERMRRQIGGKSALERALRNSRYAPLLGHRSATAQPLQQLGDSARQLVWIVDRDGEALPYLFALSRQTRGEAKDCWLLSGVTLDGSD